MGLRPFPIGRTASSTSNNNMASMDTPALLERINHQLTRAGSSVFYQKRWGAKPPRIHTLEQFQAMAPVEQGAFARDAFAVDAPRGSFFRDDVVRVNLSPSPQGLRPIYLTRNDVATVRTANARLLAAAGVRPGDVAITTLSYALFPAGLMIHESFEELGAKVIPVGPGDTERTLELIRRWNVSVLYSNPSFALRLGQEGIRGIRVLIAGGEPFSAVPGYKDKVRAALGGGVSLTESYGLAECTPVARECRFETGMHVVDDFVYVEILDPDSDRVLPLGEVGEITVTHLDKEAMPLVRYRTGDLAALGDRPCECGRCLTIEGGIRGRVGTMRKIKGVKLYPEQVRAVLDTVDAVQGRRYRLYMRQQDRGTAHLRLEIEGPTLADGVAEQVAAAFRRDIVIVPNRIDAVETLADGPLLSDENPKI